jgi:hypothetical protein
MKGGVEYKTWQALFFKVTTAAKNYAQVSLAKAVL